MEFTFTKWVDHFEENKRNLPTLDWEDQYLLTSDEYHTIYHSIQQFQIGENSEGTFLFEAAKRYTAGTDDKSYLQALMLFIKEEQRHATELATFMDQQGIPKIKKHWVDQVFRKLRRFANLEQSIIVLLTAEIIATVYYDALKRVTKSKILIGICEQILRDEAKHVEFQSEALHLISKHRNHKWRHMVSFIRKFLLWGTVVVVWGYHKKVFRSGGYSFMRYAKSAFKEFYRTESIIG